jgi:hypothetical protein
MRLRRSWSVGPARERLREVRNRRLVVCRDRIAVAIELLRASMFSIAIPMVNNCIASRA